MQVWCGVRGGEGGVSMMLSVKLKPWALKYTKENEHKRK